MHRKAVEHFQISLYKTIDDSIKDGATDENTILKFNATMKKWTNIYTDQPIIFSNSENLKSHKPYAKAHF